MTGFISNKSDAIGRLYDYVNYSDEKFTKNINDMNESIKINQSHQYPTGYKNFNDDVLLYADFSDSQNIGKDLSGNNRHGKNDYGCIYEKSVERVNSVKIPSLIIQGAEIIGRENHRCIDFSEHASIFNLPSFTVAFWFKFTASTTAGTLIGIHNNNKEGNIETIGLHFFVQHTSNKLMISGQGQNPFVVETGSLTPETWYHCSFSMDSSGNKLYLNGSSVGTYTTGTSASYLNLSTMSINKVSLGAKYMYRATNSTNYEMKNYPFNGHISDFIVFNRKLSDDEVSSIRNDNYGYDVIVLAGQSNMVNSASYSGVVNGIDDDFSLYDNRVYYWDTYNNFTYSNFGLTTAAAAIKPTTAIFKLNTMTLPFIQVGLGGSHATNCCMARTLINNILEYGSIPYRRRLLILPLAYTGTGFIDGGGGGFGYHGVGKLLREATKASLNDIMIKNPNTKIMMFAWNQGEYDMLCLNRNYKTDFLNMINEFEKTIKGFTKDIPKIMALPSGYLEQYMDTTTTPPTYMKPYIHKQLIEIAMSHPSYGLVDLRDAEYLSDRLHLTNTSVRMAGEKYFDAYCKVVGLSRKPTNQTLIFNPKYSKKTIELKSDLFLKPINKSGWMDLSIGGFGNRTMTLPCTLAYTGNAIFKIVKLSSLVIITLKDTITFTAGSSANIRIVAGGLPNELVPTEDSITISKGLKASSPVFIDWQFLPTGEINIKPSEEATFENTGSYTLYPFTMIYESVNMF